MKLLALGNPIKKPPRSDERDGDLFCGTLPGDLINKTTIVSSGCTYPTHEMNTIRVKNMGNESIYITSPTGSVLVNVPRLSGNVSIDVNVSDYDYVSCSTTYLFSITIVS